MKKILVPTDFSEQAVNALDFAAQIAKKHNSEVHVLHILELPDGHDIHITGEASGSDPMTGVFVNLLIKKARKSLATIAASKRFEGIKIKTHLTSGNAYKSIIKTITDTKSDLIVMGTKGASGIDELMVGSNAEKIVRNAPCPVITMKAKANGEKIKNIVFATDFMQNQDKLVKALKTLQEFFGATIHLLRVNTPGGFESDRVVKSNMEKFIKKYKLDNITLNVYNHTMEDEGLIYFADEINADMIAMGTHGRRGIARFLAGSIAEDVVNHAKRPVWTFKID